MKGTMQERCLPSWGLPACPPPRVVKMASNSRMISSIRSFIRPGNRRNPKVLKNVSCCSVSLRSAMEIRGGKGDGRRFPVVETTQFRTSLSISTRQSQRIGLNLLPQNPYYAQFSYAPRHEYQTPY